MTRTSRSEFFDHTADIGLRIEAADLPSLFIEAARAVVGWLGDLVPGDGPEVPAAFELRAEQPEHLLVDWLGEILYRVQDERRLPSPRTALSFHPGRLTVRTAWIPIDPERSCVRHELKAATYHGLELRAADDGDGYVATVVLDV